MATPVKNIAVATNEAGKCVCLRYEAPRGVVHSGFHYVAVDGVVIGNERMSFEEASTEFVRQLSI